MTAIITIPIDSGYVSLISMLLIQIFIIRSAVKSHILSLDLEVKRRLDKGEEVELKRVSFGPLKINSRLGLKTGSLCITPAIFIIILATLGKLGISGRTIVNYNTQDVFSAGGYFKMADVNGSQRSNFKFHGIWQRCIEYRAHSVIGHSITTSYEQTDGYLKMDNSLCSENDDVLLYDIYPQCENFNDNGFEYIIDSIGGVVYEEPGRINIFDKSIGNTTVTIGTAYTDRCNEDDWRKSAIFWVESEKIDRTCAIIDDSFSVDGQRERWVIDPFSSKSFVRSISSKIIIECIEGCFESVVEWCLSENGIDIRQTSVFMSIWYEGLNFGTHSSGNYSVDSIPSCKETNDIWDFRGVEYPFKVGTCKDAVGSGRLPSGLENVTIFSGKSISMLTISSVLAIVYYFITRKGGYGIMGFSGLSRLCDREANPVSPLGEGGVLTVRLENGIVKTVTRNLNGDIL